MNMHVLPAVAGESTPLSPLVRPTQLLDESKLPKNKKARARIEQPYRTRLQTLLEVIETGRYTQHQAMVETARLCEQTVGCINATYRTVATAELRTYCEAFSRPQCQKAQAAGRGKSRVQRGHETRHTPVPSPWLMPADQRATLVPAVSQLLERSFGHVRLAAACARVAPKGVPWQNLHITYCRLQLAALMRC